MSSFENPSSSRNNALEAGKLSIERERLLREKKEETEVTKEVFEYFREKKKIVSEWITKNRILALRRRFETTRSLDDLKRIVREELKSPDITEEDIRKIREIFESVHESARKELETLKNRLHPLAASPQVVIPREMFPFHSFWLIQDMENTPLGENVLKDIGAVSIGILESSYILGREAFFLILDGLLLPYHIYKDIKTSHK